MNDIKTWEERMSTSGRRECEALAVELMQVEIAEYRALAARATPAQPVPVAWLVEFEYLAGTTKRGPALKVVAEHWGTHRSVTLDKAEACLPDDFGACEVRNYKKTLLGPIATPSPTSDVSAPSPSSVGAAIPEGWKLVPIEPTDAMKWEAEEIEVGNALWDGSQSTCSSSEAEKIYKAMLAAAPSIAQDGQKSEGGHG